MEYLTSIIDATPIIAPFAIMVTAVIKEEVKKARRRRSHLARFLA